MAKRGVGMVEDTINKHTAVSFEFNIKKDEDIFNIRNATLNLLKVMWKSDKSLQVKSKIYETVWGANGEFPTDEEFLKHFVVNEVPSRYSNNKVIANTTLISSDDITRIKWRPLVRDYIFDKKIWSKEDRYETRVTSTPGYFIRIHPQAMNKEQLENEIENALMPVEVDEEKSCSRLAQ